MRYFVEEITILRDGSAPIAITEKANEQEARAAYHQVMASAIINPDVVIVHAEAKNSSGGIYESGTWVAQTEDVVE